MSEPKILKKIYISGAISNLPEEEYTANFERAEKFLRANGYEPINPLKVLKKGESPNDTLMFCSGLYMLNNWLNSIGARADYEYSLQTPNMLYLFEQETRLQYAQRLFHTLSQDEKIDVWSNCIMNIQRKTGVSWTEGNSEDVILFIEDYKRKTELE